MLSQDLAADLAELQIADLQDLCQEVGLDHKGNSAHLRSRLKRYVESRRAEPWTLLQPPPPIPPPPPFPSSSLFSQFQPSGNLSNPTLSTSNWSTVFAPSTIPPTVNNANQTTNTAHSSPVISGSAPNTITVTTSNTSPVQSTIFQANLPNNNTSAQYSTQINPPTSNPVNTQIPATTTYANIANLLQQQSSNASMHPNISQNMSNLPMAPTFQQSSVPQQQTQNLQMLMHNFNIFMQFMDFMQWRNQQPPVVPNLPINYNAAQTNPSFINPSSVVNQTNTAPPGFPTIGTTHQNLDLSCFETQNQQQPFKIDVKRISYISSSLEKRKIFFSGRQGSDAYRFITYLEETARFMGLTEEELFCCLPIVLTSEALEWFRLEEKKLANFANFKRSFLEHYSIPYYQDRLMEEARNRTQAKSEPILSYITCLRIIFDKMNPHLSLSRQLDIACQNLNPTFSMQINRDRICTFEDLLNAGKQVEIKLLNIRKYKDPPSPDTALLANAAWHPPKSEQVQKRTPSQSKNSKSNTAATTESECATIKTEGTKKPKKLPKQSIKTSETKSIPPVSNTELSTPNNVASNPKPPSPPKFQHPEMPRFGECFKCRQPGHRFSDCRYKRVFRIFCYSCGKANVTSSRCPACLKKKEENARGDQPQ